MTADLRYAVRTLIAGRLFTVVAVTSLALGIATNTTMFSVFDAMFLRPLPFEDAGRLVSIAGRHPETGRRVALSLDDLRELTPAVASLETIAAYSGRTVDAHRRRRTRADRGAARHRQPLSAARQAAAAAGRASPATTTGPRPRAWRSSATRCGGGATRRTVPRSAASSGWTTCAYTIVGVMPPKFQFPEHERALDSADAGPRRRGRGDARPSRSSDASRRTRRSNGPTPSWRRESLPAPRLARGRAAGFARLVPIARSSAARNARSPAR